jgi:hypothetical protein
MVFQTSCGKEDAFTLPDNVYTIAKVYDVGNSGNSTDIRVHLTFLASVNTSDLVESKLVIVKGTQSLSKEQVAALSPDRFMAIPLSNTAKQVVKPTSTMKDADGDPIVNGSYKVYVAVQGKQDALQISNGKEFTLSDVSIYSGDYTGTWQDLGPPGPAQFPMSMRIAADYTGRMFYANANFAPFGSGAQDALVTLTVNGSIITSFVLNQFISGYNGGCSANKTLTGHFDDDINLVLDTFSWADCDGTRDVVLKFTRQ